MQVYDVKAAALHALDPARFTERLFVSTEDPDTIEYFDQAAAAAGGNITGGGRSGVPWRAAYVKGVPRKPDRYSGTPVITLRCSTCKPRLLHARHYAEPRGDEGGHCCVAPSSMQLARRAE